MSQIKNNPSIKIIVIVITLILIAIAGTIGKKVASNLFNGPEVTIDTQLMKISNEINKNCPFMIDSETQLNNTGVISRDLYYNCTLINYVIDEIDIDYLRFNLRPTILNGIKTNPDLKYFRDYKVTFIYNYKDRNGVHVLSLKFTPEEYL